MSILATSPARTRRWTRAEYERLIAVGVVRPGEPVELLGGDLIVAEPQGSAHHGAPFGWRYALHEVRGPIGRSPTCFRSAKPGSATGTLYSAAQ